MPCVVSDQMVQSMKSGSIVIDVSIDQGGCFETSEVTSHKPVFVKYDVIHYCVPNIASRVARTASLSISNLLTPILISIGDLGGIDNAIRINEFLRSGVYNYNGKHTNKILSKNFKLSYYDLNLLMGE